MKGINIYKALINLYSRYGFYKETSDQGKYQQNPSGSAQGGNYNQGRFGRNSIHGTIHGDIAPRHIKPKRIETIEDIRADIERVEKDIQLEIKQIRAAKLGL